MNFYPRDSRMRVSRVNSRLKDIVLPGYKFWKVIWPVRRLHCYLESYNFSMLLNLRMRARLGCVLHATCALVCGILHGGSAAVLNQCTGSRRLPAAGCRMRLQTAGCRPRCPNWNAHPKDINELRVCWQQRLGPVWATELSVTNSQTDIATDRHKQRHN